MLLKSAARERARSRTTMSRALSVQRDPHRSQAETNSSLVGSNRDQSDQIETRSKPIGALEGSQTASDTNRTKPSLVGVKSRQIEPRRCQIGAQSEPIRALEGQSESGEAYPASFEPLRSLAMSNRRSRL